MMVELVPRVLGHAQPMAFLSGPTFAKELMDAYPSGAVMASQDMTIAEACANLFHSEVLRIYTTTDVVGVEVGGALKNVYALAAGVVEGMGLGVNPVAFMVTRACAEMNLLAVALGARAHTMAGLAGIGDLMLTCMGGASRNKAVGICIGKGESIASILESRQQSLSGVAEGVATAPAAVKLARRLGVNSPLAEAVNAVLEGAAGPREAIMTLMQRPRGEDFAAAAHEAEEKLKQKQALALGGSARPSPLGVPPFAWAALALGDAALLLGLAGAALVARGRGTKT
jgi:glycerol-3-phosphate dehydrogenase (NAD+)